MSVTTRSLIAFLLIVTGAFYFLIERLTDRVERQYLEAAEEPMVDFAHVLAALLEQELGGDTLDFTKARRALDTAHSRDLEARIYNLVKRRVDLHVYVTDTNGIVRFDSRNGEAEGQDYRGFHDVQRTLQGVYGARSSRSNEENDRSSIMYVAAPIRRGRTIVGVVTVSKPQASMFGFIAETKRRIRLYGWSVLLATMMAAVAVSHLFASPIRKLTEYARAVRRGDRVSMPNLGSPDVRVLGRALEEMRDSLEDRKYVESYVQTLTHEMKGPVAGIRGAAELLQDPTMPAAGRVHFLDNIRTESDRLQRIIDRFLALSAIESMKTLKHPKEIVLTDLVDDVCAIHRHELEARQLEVRKEYQGRPVVRGETFLLETAVGNLLQNAIDFSPPGGKITVEVACLPEGEQVEIAIQDEGPGVPVYARERVFERFYSLRHPATGKKSSGLGLCFVREAALLHGGTAVLDHRPAGSQTRFVMRMRARG